MAELLRKARGLGIPEADLRQSIDEQITASYRVNPQQAVFVECNMEDARAAVDEIEAYDRPPAPLPRRLAVVTIDGNR